MKLALVTRRYPPLIGGAEKVLSYLAAALAAEGADVTVLTAQAPGMILSDREEIPIETASRARRKGDESPRGRLAVVRLATSSLRFWGTWQYMRNLGRWFRDNPVNLAYVSMLKHDAYVTLGAGRRLGFPVVLRPRGPARRATSPGKGGAISGGGSGDGVGPRTPSSRSPRPSRRTCAKPGEAGHCANRRSTGC